MESDAFYNPMHSCYYTDIYKFVTANEHDYASGRLANRTKAFPYSTPNSPQV